jgi:HD-like signal output (HDOD) protein
MLYTIEEIIETIEDKMSSLSPTTAKVLQLVNDMNCSPMELTKVIKLDPVLSAKVLKVVNSSYFSVSQKVTSLERAIIMLGLNTIKNLALSAAVLSQFAQKNFSYAFDVNEFWKHSLSVAVTAKLIAAERKISKLFIENYFIAGLLHDIGLLVENMCYQNEMKEIISEVKTNQKSLIEVEESVLNGLNHCKVGKALGEKWNLSNDLITVMEKHHDIELVGEQVEFNLTVYLANIICKKNNVGLVIEELDYSIPTVVFKALGLTADIEEKISNNLNDEIQKAMEFLKL